MKTGIVKFYNTEKSFGFIIDDADGTEYFVHKSGLNHDELEKGDKVEFELKEGKKGLNAVNVTIL